MARTASHHALVDQTDSTKKKKKDGRLTFAPSKFVQMTHLPETYHIGKLMGDASARTPAPACVVHLYFLHFLHFPRSRRVDTSPLPAPSARTQEPPALAPLSAHMWGPSAPSLRIEHTRTAYACAGCFLRPLHTRTACTVP
jgi:hypothetical protein